MSSPPDSSTSNKAGHLHTIDQKDQQRSLSFPSALNPFHRKAPPKSVKTPLPVEPYEVAPGIWNTDATAQVFGYLDTDAKDKTKGQAPLRKPVPPKHPGSPGQNVPGNISFKVSPLNNQHRRVGPNPLPQHEGKGQPTLDVRKTQQHTEFQGFQGMRTVSREDRLVQRGANPRTGLVSPFITSDTSDDNVVRDHLSLGKPFLDRPEPKGRSRSGKWRQGRFGWSLVESPLLSPIAQSTTGPLSRKVSVKKLEDKLLLQMPGVDNPEPNNMTEQQMKKYQKSIAQAVKKGGNNAMVDPDALPSPRPVTPEGPSTPPNKLHRIRRKMVGSGPGRGEESNETILVNDKAIATSSAPTTRRKDKGTQKVKIVTPVHTAIESSHKSHAQPKMSSANDAFLGLRITQRLGQVGETSRSPQFQGMQERQQVQSRSLTNLSNRAEVESFAPQAFPTLEQYLPRLQLLHPSHFANLEKSSYRRPAELLPAHLRPTEGQKKIIEGACTTTITSTLRKTPEKTQGSKAPRQSKTTTIPRVKAFSIQAPEGSKENYVRESSPRKRLSYTSILADDSGSKGPRQNRLHHLHRSPIATREPEVQHRTEALYQWTLPSSESRGQGAERKATLNTFDDSHYQQAEWTAPRKSSGAIPMAQSMRARSANTIQGPTQDTERNGVGSTRTQDHHGGNGENGGMWSMSGDDVAGKDGNIEYKAGNPTEIAFKGDGSVWFAGHWAGSSHNQNNTSHRVLEPEASLHQESLHAATIIEQCASRLLVSLWSSVTPRSVQSYLFRMADHTIRTFNIDSPPLAVLRTSDAKILDYVRATKEVILACICLTLLLHALLVVRKVLVILSVIMYWLWHPLRTLLAIAKWCVLA